MVALPPTDHKADWNDYHQKHGIKCATEAFNTSMYQPQGNGVKQEPQTIEGSDFKVMDTDPLKPRIESREDGIYWYLRELTARVEKSSITKAGYVLR